MSLLSSSSVGRRWLSVSPALAEKPVALVIGNSAYKLTAKLDNPKSDASEMAAALRTLRFETIDGYDLDKSGPDRKIRDFAMALGAFNEAIFGHIEVVAEFA